MEYITILSIFASVVATITSISVTEDTIILYCRNMQRGIVRITIDREDLYKLV